LQRIAVIFAIEADIQGQRPEEQMRQRRLRTRPVLDELQRWLVATLPQVSAKSPMALATGYAMRQRPEALATALTPRRNSVLQSSRPELVLLTRQGGRNLLKLPHLRALL